MGVFLVHLWCSRVQRIPTTTVISSCLGVLWIDMTKNQLVDNLETVAISGAGALKEAMSAG